MKKRERKEIESGNNQAIEEIEKARGMPRTLELMMLTEIRIQTPTPQMLAAMIIKHILWRCRLKEAIL